MYPSVIVSRYSYQVRWSEEDNEYVATCIELPGLSWLDKSSTAALNGIRKIVGESVADMMGNGLMVPEPRDAGFPSV